MPPIPKTTLLANLCRFVYLPALLLVMLASARAEDLTTVLVQPTAPFSASGPFHVWLYSMNNSPVAVSQNFPHTLDGALATANGSTNVVLTLLSDSGPEVVTIGPGAFAKREYALNTFVNEGRATLTVENYNPVTLVVQNSGQPAPPVAATATPAAPVTPPAPATTRGSTRPVEEFLTRHLSTYEPIYFILGTYPAAEFQFSLKYQLFAFDEEDSVFKNAADHFYFGFTQTSFWDLISRDPSFYDTSYKPSLFFYYTNVLESPSNSPVTLDLQVGAEHESNGKGDTGERSLYTGYIQPRVDFKLPEHFDFSLQPRAREYFLVGHNNPDIADYRGYVDLLAALTWTQPKEDGEKVQLALKYQIGQAGRHAGYKVDLRFNLAGIHFLSAFKPTIQLQYFDGYGQTLLQYNESSRSYRAGMCLWFF